MGLAEKAKAKAKANAEVSAAAPTAPPLSSIKAPGHADIQNHRSVDLLVIAENG